MSIDESRILIGIDPGKSGGISVIHPSTGEYTSVYSDQELVSICKESHDSVYPIMVCVEQVNAMPKQGVVSVFTFGKSAGFIEGVLQAFAIPYQLIRPPIWKKEFNLIGKDKQASIEVCRKLFPKLNLKATERSRKDHDGKAESMLLAEFARRNM